MKKILLFVISVISVIPAVSKTLRVNNTEGAGAQYTTIAAALEAAVDGDLIIVDGSATSYGDSIFIDKSVTLQGPGYFLEANGLSDIGYQEAKLGVVVVSADGAKLIGLTCDNVRLLANNIIVTRCYISYIGVDRDCTVSNCVIHQNFIGTMDRYFNAGGKFFQVTNNIFKGGGLDNLDQSVISRNSFDYKDEYYGLSNCVISHNIGTFRRLGGGDNSFVDNIDVIGYGNNFTDKTVKEKDVLSSTEHGAFSGDDPYVLGGKPTGVYIKSVSIPESVVKGETLNGQITIELSR